MYDVEDRKQLVEILDREYQKARDIIVNGKVMPSAMTHNQDKVGLTISFRKLRTKSRVDGDLE